MLCSYFCFICNLSWIFQLYNYIMKSFNFTLLFYIFKLPVKKKNKCFTIIAMGSTSSTLFISRGILTLFLPPALFLYLVYWFLGLLWCPRVLVNISPILIFLFFFIVDKKLWRIYQMPFQHPGKWSYDFSL